MFPMRDAVCRSHFRLSSFFFSPLVSLGMGFSGVSFFSVALLKPFYEYTSE